MYLYRQLQSCANVSPLVPSLISFVRARLFYIHASCLAVEEKSRFAHRINFAAYKNGINEYGMRPFYSCQF